ncbi:hypothetical protein SH501x_003792 [Pirellulaceae bacterium SH501]
MNSDSHHRFVSITAVGVFVASILIGCAQSPEDDRQGPNEGTVVERKYLVSDIIRSYDSPKSLPERVDEWIVCVTANIEPGNWNTDKFSIAADHESESILAKCNDATHDRIHALLEDIRKMNNQSKP